MSSPHVLMVGCGDLGIRLGKQLAAEGWRVSAVRRRVDPLPDNFNAITGDYTQRADLTGLIDLQPDYVVFTPLPTARDSAGYYQGYAAPVAQMAELGLLSSLKGGVLVSSTRVYAQAGGGWVDESSPLTQTDPLAASIIEAERQFLAVCPGATVLRASGIYGEWPGMLIQRLQKGLCSPDPKRISNRIHRDDLAGIMAFCLRRLEQGETNDPVYIASDQRPSQVGEVEAWLIKRLGLSAMKGVATSRLANRRCSSQLLRSAGYRFSYPDYQTGFSALMAQHLP
ncbi:MAG: SDR family oxidoreductase [Luminiphilus sp.]|nr:SDR family oxidoreductase [Luminiphilus sp.]MDG2442901.1 SDR family oxidoreductase [Luminiphilus sp.]